MQLHLDFEVDDLDGGRRPRRGGGGGAARRPQDDDEVVRVYPDPAGHPFCLFVRR